MLMLSSETGCDVRRNSETKQKQRTTRRKKDEKQNAYDVSFSFSLVFTRLSSCVWARVCFSSFSSYSSKLVSLIHSSYSWPHPWTRSRAISSANWNLTARLCKAFLNNASVRWVRLILRAARTGETSRVSIIQLKSLGRCSRLVEKKQVEAITSNDDWTVEEEETSSSDFLKNVIIICIAATYLLLIILHLINGTFLWFRRMLSARLHSITASKKPRGTVIAWKSLLSRDTRMFSLKCSFHLLMDPHGAPLLPLSIVNCDWRKKRNVRLIDLNDMQPSPDVTICTFSTAFARFPARSEPCDIGNTLTDGPWPDLYLSNTSRIHIIVVATGNHRCRLDWFV